MLHVMQSGMYTTVQDAGRTGFTKNGIPIGGAMDMYAYAMGNAILGNAKSCASLEIVFGMAEFRFDTDTVIAITGADMQTTCNGKRIMNWCSHFIHAGDVVRFHPRQLGMRAYLSVTGGLKTPQYYNSHSTTPHLGIGNIIATGDVLPYSPLPVSANTKSIGIMRGDIPDYKECILEYIPGYQNAFFDSADIETKLFKITNENNRMGYRLNGKGLTYNGTEIYSEAIATGAIQISNDGLPIVLMRDGQTIGGYPKIGCLTEHSMSILSQKASGDTIGFKSVKYEKSLQSAKNIWEKFKNYSMYREV